MTQSNKPTGKPHKSAVGKTVQRVAGRGLAETQGKPLRREMGEVSHASRVIIERTSTTLRKALKRLADR
jgi:hypothetical protein